MMPDAVPSSFEIGIRMVFSLFVVAAFIFIGHFLIKKLGMRGMKFGKEMPMDVLSYLPIGPKKYIYLVHVVGCIFVLGVTDEQITLLHTIENPQLVEDYLTQTQVKSETKKWGKSLAKRDPAPSGGGNGEMRK